MDEETEDGSREDEEPAEAPTSDDPEPNSDLTPLPVSAAQLFGALAGGIAGLQLGPEASLAGGAAGQVMLGVAVERVLHFRRSQGERVLEIARAESGLGEGELIDRLTADPARTQLLASALGAASSAIAEEKLKALGRIMASGALADDDAVLDRHHLMVRALADIEKPHLRVLDHMYPRRPENYTDELWTRRPIHKHAQGYSTATLKEGGKFGDPGLPHLALGMEGLLGTLQSHGLVELRSGDWSKIIERVGIESVRGSKAKDHWVITPFGCHFFEFVQAAGSAEVSD